MSELWKIAVAFVASGVLAGAACAETVAEFYKNKTITLLVGFGPGGANDAWARLIARHMSKHLPGTSAIVVQNVPGAGGLQVTNQLYNVAPKDGTVFGLISRGIPLEPLLGGQGVQFDPAKMNWIGSPDKDVTVCAARKDAAVQKMQDLFSKELVVGATGSGADTAIYPEFLADFLGMKFKVVKGYKGSNEIVLAMERGEVQGICFAYDSLMRTNIARDGKVSILFQAALKPDPKLGNVPVATELARSPEERHSLELFLARVALGRPFVAPPGVPADRVAALRQAFGETLRDPELAVEGAPQGLTVEPITGAEIEEILAKAYKTAPDIVKRTAEVLGRASKKSQPP